MGRDFNFHILFALPFLSNCNDLCCLSRFSSSTWIADCLFSTCILLEIRVSGLLNCISTMIAIYLSFKFPLFKLDKILSLFQLLSVYLDGFTFEFPFRDGNCQYLVFEFGAAHLVLKGAEQIALFVPVKNCVSSPLSFTGKCAFLAGLWRFFIPLFLFFVLGFFLFRSHFHSKLIWIVPNSSCVLGPTF